MIDGVEPNVDLLDRRHESGRTTLVFYGALGDMHPIFFIFSADVSPDAPSATV